MQLFTKYVVARARVVDFEKFKVSWSKKFPEISMGLCEEIQALAV